MEAAIQEGRVLVNGKQATLGARATPQDRIQMDGKPVARASGKRRLLLYFKPAGKVVSREEESADSVFDDLPPAGGGRWISIGRLDVNSEGLLLFSTDGNWAHSMMHPRNSIEREYRARASGALAPQVLEDACQRGVKVGSGAPIRPAHFALERSGDGANSWYRIILVEGRNRAVRRLFEHYGLQVSRLLRVRFGDYKLPAALAPGEWQEIDLPAAS